MTPQEVQEAYKELQDKGLSTDEIASALGKMFEKGDISKDQLSALLEPLGLKLTPEFAKLSEEEARDPSNLWKTDPGEADPPATNEQVEESEESGSEEAPDSRSKPAEGNQPEGEEADREKADREKAMRLMNLRSKSI